MKNNLLLLLFLLIGSYAHAVQVEGVVIDENKEPVIGATVMLKGAQGVGTITDFDGKFLLEVENVRDAVLVISYIGYKNKHFPLKGRVRMSAA